MNGVKVIFIGRLTRDGELQFSPEGKPRLNFTVAVDDGYGANKTTVWMRCTLFGNRAEALQQYLTRGKMVAVEGTLFPGEDGNPRVFQRRNGEYGASYDVTVREIKLLCGGERKQAPQSQQPTAAGNVFDLNNPPDSFDLPGEQEEIPF